MPIVPFRGLAERGILTDPSAYELDLTSWSGGSNVRFDSQKAMRAPIWRSVFPGLPKAPAFCVGYTPSSGYDQVMVVATDGTTVSYSDQLATQVTPTGFVPYTQMSQSCTSCELGDVIYINNPQGIPQYYGPGSTTFTNIPGWSSTWSARVLRAYSDYIVAFNVTKAGVAFNNMVKWSDLTLYGQPPDSWDSTNPNLSAGENPLEGLKSPIIEAQPLGSAMVIYSYDQTWLMQANGTYEIFQFNQIFSEGGCLAPNCVVEVNNRHYVFGVDDIWTHDGTSKQSIATQRIRQFVYRNINMSQSERCFVHHMPKYNEIMFAFVSQDVNAYWQSPSAGCNRAVVYNYDQDVWSMVDLPGLVAMTRANVQQTLTYFDSPPLTFQNLGGSFSDLNDGFHRHEVAVNQAEVPGVTGNQVLAYDFMNKGDLPYPFDPTCNAPAYLERIGLDLDQQGGDLTTYKMIRRVYPQITTFDSVPVQVEIGAQLMPSSPLVYLPAVSFDPTQQYKVDGRIGGRYLAMRFTVNQAADFEISGFDIDVYMAGRR